MTTGPAVGMQWHRFAGTHRGIEHANGIVLEENMVIVRRGNYGVERVSQTGDCGHGPDYIARSMCHRLHGRRTANCSILSVAIENYQKAECYHDADLHDQVEIDPERRPATPDQRRDAVRVGERAAINRARNQSGEEPESREAGQHQNQIEAMRGERGPVSNSSTVP